MKINLEEIVGCEDVYWVQLPQDGPSDRLL
jgi:hypothetical protein